jgi:succinate dehydrogenase/fumarate reductase flavoprotein subunit
MEMLKKLAWENLLVVRTRDGLLQLLEGIEGIRKNMVHQLSVEGTGDLIKSLELNDMLRAGEIVGRAALMRTESRGSHYRDDFPERDDDHWLRSIVVNKVQEEMNLITTKLDEQWQMAPDDLKGLWWG